MVWSVSAQQTSYENRSIVTSNWVRFVDARLIAYQVEVGLASDGGEVIKAVESHLKETSLKSFLHLRPLIRKGDESTRLLSGLQRATCEDDSEAVWSDLGGNTFQDTLNVAKALSNTVLQVTFVSAESRNDVLHS
jgi:hypothetical protein